MKKLIFTLLISSAIFCGCQDDPEVFGVTPTLDNITEIKPISGGAVMHYTLPANEDVMAIRVRYTNSRGKEVVRTGSYACDTLVLYGFDEARTGVEALVTLCDRRKIESEPVKVRFNTLDSGPIAFFKDLEVHPDWNGFRMSYNIPDGARGLMHVYYLGKSPITQEIDTLRLATYAFSGGRGEQRFELKNTTVTEATVIIRTEDFGGYMVREVKYPDVGIFRPDKMTITPERFFYSNVLQVAESANNNADVIASKLGKAYLFDGDTKGAVNFPAEDGVYKTFIAGPNIINSRLPFIIDLGEAKQIAQVKLYAMLRIKGMNWTTSARLGTLFMQTYMNRLPSEVSIYGSETRPSEYNAWTGANKLGEYKDPVQESAPTGYGGATLEDYYAECWAQRCAQNDANYPEYVSLETINKADPCVMTVYAPTSAPKYRYLVIMVDRLFPTRWSHQDQNLNQYVTFHELEVYAK